MKKPPFGDVRSPKPWSNTVRKAMLEMSFYEHRLDACLYMSYRRAIIGSGDEPDSYMAEDGCYYVLDGIMGLHVDDFIGGGEGLQDCSTRSSEQQSDFRFARTCCRMRAGRSDQALKSLRLWIATASTSNTPACSTA